jgi:hypothetical protein
MSIAFLPAVPRFILAAGFCGPDQGCPIQPGLIDIKDENAILIERDFLGLPGAFVALVGVPTEVTDPSYSDKVVGGGGDPFFAEATNGRPIFG